jgi:CBS domain-containing protein
MKGHARNFMTERVTSVAPDAPLETVARTMVAGRFGGVPVVDRDGQVLGFVSEGDVVAALLAQADPRAPARDIMGGRPVVVDEFETGDEVLRVMRASHVDHVLVVRQGRLVGLITPLDVLRFFVEHILPLPPEAG